jgi:hypothetical protein
MPEHQDHRQKSNFQRDATEIARKRPGTTFIEHELFTVKSCRLKKTILKMWSQKSHNIARRKHSEDARHMEERENACNRVAGCAGDGSPVTGPPWCLDFVPRSGAFCRNGRFCSDMRPMRFGSEARFTNDDPRLIYIEFVRVPRLEDRLVPAPLRGWIADIANRGGFPYAHDRIGRGTVMIPKRF